MNIFEGFIPGIRQEDINNIYVQKKSEWTIALKPIHIGNQIINLYIFLAYRGILFVTIK